MKPCPHCGKEDCFEPVGKSSIPTIKDGMDVTVALFQCNDCGYINMYSVPIINQIQKGKR